MATLENIRKKGSLVAIVIGFALLAFILGDAFRSGDTLFRKSQFEIANIDGKSISLQEYSENVEKITEIYKARAGGSISEENMEGLRNEIWEQMLRKNILEDDYKELNVAVTPEELFDMVQGANVDPTIRQIFQNPQTGEFNRAYVLQFINNSQNDDNYRNQWMYIENTLLDSKLYNKYVNIISKGLKVSSKEAEDSYKQKSHKVNIKFIGEKYTSISDSAVKVTDSELKDYYNKHKEEYKQDENRDIVYITYDVVPSEDDIAATKAWVEDLKTDFAKTDNDEQFLRLNSPDNQYDSKFYKEHELPTNLSVFMFNSQKGDVFGPYLENNAYKLAKLAKIQSLPDTVKARHILIKPKGNKPQDVENVKKAIDSLKTLVKNGADFAKLAQENSEDQSSASKGGDLGWFDQKSMVQSFSDSCFFGKKGDLKVVYSQYGAHLVEITDKGKDTLKVQVQVLARNILPSSRTKDIAYSNASKFIGANNTPAKFDKAIAEDNTIQKKLANNITPMQKEIVGIGNARDFIRSAFNTELNEVIRDNQKNPVFEIGDKFVLGKVIAVKEKGYKSLDEVKSLITLEIIKDKKAEILINKISSKLSSANSIDALGQALSLQVGEAENVSFGSYSILGIGAEPSVIGIASVLEKNKLSAPIKGSMGVYVIEVTNVNDESASQDPKAEIESLERSLRSRARIQTYEALKEAADIKDKRSKFY